MPEETAESPKKHKKNRKQHTQKQQHPKKQQKKNTQDTRKQRTKKTTPQKNTNTKKQYKKHTQNKFWYHQHNIQHTRHYNCNYTGVDAHIYKCIDKRQYSDIVSCKYGSIATRIGDCVCQT